MGHTPGPFKIYPNRAYKNQHPNHNYRYIATADFDEDAGTGQVLAAMTDSPEIVGNAHLFEAAPDLLAALKAIEAVLDGRQPIDVKGAVMVARSAIAKAEGK